MRSFCLYCLAALTAGAVLVSNGVTDETPDPFNDEVFDTDVVSERVVEVPGPRSELEDLRVKYLEAARQRAEIMDEAALREAVESEEKSVAELRARQALKKVEQELERIADEYSETTAGQQSVEVHKLLQSLSRNGRTKSHGTSDGRFFDDPGTISEPLNEDAFDYDLPETDATPQQGRDRAFQRSKR